MVLDLEDHGYFVNMSKSKRPLLPDPGGQGVDFFRVHITFQALSNDTKFDLLLLQIKILVRVKSGFK